MTTATATKIRTKIIASLGPVSDNKESMRQMILAGVDMFRNNFAHVQYDEYKRRVEIVGELNQELGTNVQMQADLQGTNIRVGLLPGGQMELVEGKTYACVTNGGTCNDGEIPINDDHLHLEVKVGEPMSFADGAFEGIITAVEGNRISVEMTNGGILKQRKSINVPETDFQRSCITEKDRRDLAFLINETEVQWLALSFVGYAKDVTEVRELIGDKNIRIMSKIERRSAIDNIAEIITASDAIMIARGDLAIEVPFTDVPIFSKQMISLSHQQQKPVVTATQMLLSMTHSKRPTRAEISDVANAVFDKSDALMLSEETAEGAHPALAVETMVSIARRVEEYLYHNNSRFSSLGL